MAKQLVEPSAAQVRAERETELRRGQSKKPKRPETLLVGLDGGWVNSREHKKGMAGKGGVSASEMEAVGKRGCYRLSSRRSVATFEPSEQ